MAVLEGVLKELKISDCGAKKEQRNGQQDPPCKKGDKDCILRELH